MAGWCLSLPVSLIVVFILFNIVFRSVYMDFFNRTISQNGDHISSIIEGSLYYSMLENDKAMLQRTLDIISNMSGIDEVNMYDEQDNLAYTSVNAEMDSQGNPNCIDCHADLASMFSLKEKSYRGCGEYTRMRDYTRMKWNQAPADQATHSE